MLSWVLLVSGMIICTFTDSKGEEEVSCRGKSGTVPLSTFTVQSCGLCYVYLFQSTGELILDFRRFQLVSKRNGSKYTPDITNKHDYELICATLNDEDCERLSKCCRAALDCCYRHNSLLLPEIPRDYCPRTWDGFGCVDDTPAGSRAVIRCPSYIEHSSTKNKAYKDCTNGGAWFRDNVTNQEWTNYTSCYDTITNKSALFGGTMMYLILSCSVAVIAVSLLTYVDI